MGSTSPTLSTGSIVSSSHTSIASTLSSYRTASAASTSSKNSKRIVFSVKELLQCRKHAFQVPKESFKEKDILWTTLVLERSPPKVPPPTLPTYDFELRKAQPPSTVAQINPQDLRFPNLNATPNTNTLSSDAFKGAVFVALDFEGGQDIIQGAYGATGCLKAQMGVCILDTRSLSRSSPSPKSPEAILKTYNFSTCHSYCGRNTNFIFGQTQMTHVKKFQSHLENLIDRNRNIVLIGHAIPNELAVLQALKFNLQKGITGFGDTQAMMQVLSKRPSISLSDLLQRFRLEYRNLQIAGNDANFTMRAFLLLMNENASRTPVIDSSIRERILLLDRIARARLPTEVNLQLPPSGPALHVPARVSLTNRPSARIPIVPPPGFQFSRPLVPGGSALPLIPISVAPSSKRLRPESPPLFPRKVQLAWQGTTLPVPANTTPVITGISSILDEPVPAITIAVGSSIPSPFESVPTTTRPVFKIIPSPFEPMPFGRTEHERPWTTALDLETKEAREHIGFAEVLSPMCTWWKEQPHLQSQKRIHIDGGGVPGTGAKSREGEEGDTFRAEDGGWKRTAKGMESGGAEATIVVRDRARCECSVQEQVNVWLPLM
ncbi:uncharacterized protein PAC_18448 [Phialocephala subalpina]|uniref:Gfd2/YDR514C-like C-terminal domain-containing protein n=1 Tax=Phialocephala subalpina TaxID=576137 RepID=A0A1L7XU53_9HELO|nr:uncharacterized protein PAC_18448 [Phialocephala subalpina]